MYAPSEREAVIDFFTSIGAIGNIGWMLDAVALLRDNPNYEDAAGELRRIGLILPDDEGFRASMELCRRVLVKSDRPMCQHRNGYDCP